MSNASSNQSFFRDGAGYEEMYPSSYREQDDLSEKSPSASSSSSKNEDTEVLMTAKTKELNTSWVLMDLGSSSCYQIGR